MNRLFAALLLAPCLLAGCASNEPAPVVDRNPVAKKTSATKTPANSAADKDWRPDMYTVKRGDTLYSIGLQYGYDYKEIAQANNIAPPYTIRLGQQLKLKDKSADGKPAVDSKVAPAESVQDDGVIIAPLKTDNVSATPMSSSSSSMPATTMPAGSTSTVQSTTVQSAEIPFVTEPKALREPYSEQALLAKPPASKPVIVAKPAEAVKPADAAKPGDVAAPAKAVEAPKPAIAKADSSPAGTGDEDIAWAWPTQGKVVTAFNADSSAKGIDIAGTTGQAITAAAPGKVIYSGSDLRGYGKLVIIKHNKTYLSVYAHNSKIVVKEGDTIAKGQKIAEMGNTDADSVKLHFEIRQQGRSIDPAKYLPAN